MSTLTMPGLTERFPGDNPVPHHDIGPADRIPRLALVASLGNHLDVNGMFVLSRLAAFLREIETGQHPGLLLRERVLIIPSISSSPSVSGSDSRRTGWVRCANTEATVDLTRIAYYRVDIFPASPDIEEMPHLRLYGPNDDERASACLFGLPAVIERPLEPGDSSGLVRWWRLHGGENFSIHAGRAGSLQKIPCDVLFHALLAFLDRTGMVIGLNLANDEEDLRYFGVQQLSVFLAERSGVFSTAQLVGRWIRAGDELGRIYDNFNGRQLLEVIAPEEGLLCSLRRQPLVKEGELLAHILLPQNTRKLKTASWRGKRCERR